MPSKSVSENPPILGVTLQPAGSPLPRILLWALSLTMEPRGVAEVMSAADHFWRPSNAELIASGVVVIGADWHFLRWTYLAV